jgi:hypothetical protein
MRTKFSFLIPGLLLLAGACADTESPPVVFDTEGWIDTAPAGPPNQKPSLTAGEGDDEDEGDEGEEGFFAAFSVSGAFTNGEVSGLTGEFFAEENGELLCQIEYPVSLVGSIAPCPECTYAWEFSFGEAEVVADANGACATYNGTSMSGQNIRLGANEQEALYREGSDGWEAIGETFFEEGEIFMEWEWDA